MEGGWRMVEGSIKKNSHTHVWRIRNAEKKNCCSARTLKYSVTNRVDLYCSGNGRGHLRGGGRGVEVGACSLFCVGLPGRPLVDC